MTSSSPLLSSVRTALAVSTIILALSGLGGMSASAQDLGARLDAKQGELDEAQQQEGVLVSALERLSSEVARITGEVAALRTREAVVREELVQTEAELGEARDRLQVARRQLQRATRVLRERLVQIYKADEPDVLAVILDADGFDDLLSQYEYLSSVQDQDDSIVERVRDLRDQTRESVSVIRVARDEIAAKQAELLRTRQQLEAREASLVAARERQSSALERTRTDIGSLQGDLSDLERRIQAELQAAQEAAEREAAEAAAAAAAEATPSPAPSQPPAGPIQGETSSGLIWPVNGTVTSPFGPRWGSLHAGIDIGAAEGTPIQAAAGGQVVMAGWNGGYGNYTCIDHGGGLSTCYAHQSSIGVSAGQTVSQGEAIGAVGNTGNSFGAHLHFETRFNGVAEDPMGYL